MRCLPESKYFAACLLIGATLVAVLLFKRTFVALCGVFLDWLYFRGIIFLVVAAL